MIKEKGQRDKQRSTKHTHKIKDGVIRTPLKTGGGTQVLKFKLFSERTSSIQQNVKYNYPPNTTGATSRTRTASLSGAPESLPRFLMGFVLLHL
jgi:hypothetical protein